MAARPVETVRSQHAVAVSIPQIFVNVEYKWLEIKNVVAKCMTLSYITDSFPVS